MAKMKDEILAADPSSGSGSTQDPSPVQAFNVILTHPVYSEFGQDPFMPGDTVAAEEGTVREWLLRDICVLAEGVVLPKPKNIKNSKYEPIPKPARDVRNDR